MVFALFKVWPTSLQMQGPYRIQWINLKGVVEVKARDSSNDPKMF